MKARTPAEIATKFIAIGEAKANNNILRILLLGSLAGVFIGLSAAGANTAMATIANPSVAKLISACVFPCALVMILLAGAELFTGNCLMVVPLLQGQISLSKMLRNWLFVYLGNFVGSMLAVLVVLGGSQLELLGDATVYATIKVAVAKLSYNFGAAFFLGIGCNLLVCIAVWVSYATDNVAGKIAALYMPIMMFVLCGFEHCIANMYYVPAGILAAQNPLYAAVAVEAGLDISQLTWGNFALRNLLPVTLGNLVGGGLLVALPYWYCYLLPGQKAKKALASQSVEQ